ncbi:MAG: hypothetical protein L0H94_12645, partial [Nitrospira sp.]|nr:hypothetical protein [Nitrospira sp.]
AREGLNTHLERARNYFDEEVTGVRRFTELHRLVRFYLPWYWRQWVRRRLPSGNSFQHPRVWPKLAFVERASRRLARAMFYAMLFHRQTLRDDQGRQNRIEVIGEDLLVIATTALYAERQERTAGRPEVWDLAEEVFRETAPRIEQNLRALIRNRDELVTAVGRRALSGTYPSLSGGIIRRGLQDYLFRRESPLNAGKESERKAI